MLNNIKLERIKKDITQIEAAKKLNITDTTYRKKEKDGSFTGSELKILAAFYNCSVDYLLEGMYEK